MYSEFQEEISEIFSLKLNWQIWINIYCLNPKFSKPMYLKSILLTAFSDSTQFNKSLFYYFGSLPAQHIIRLDWSLQPGQRQWIMMTAVIPQLGLRTNRTWNFTVSVLHSVSNSGVQSSPLTGSVSHSVISSAETQINGPTCIERFKVFHSAT